MTHRLSSLLEWCNCFALATAERMGNYRITAGFGQNVSTFRDRPGNYLRSISPAVFLWLASATVEKELKC